MIYSLLHVIDDSVCQEQKNEVLLIIVRDPLVLGHIGHDLDDVSEVSRSMELYSIDRMLVGIDDPLNSIALRIEIVSVHSEAVRRLRQIGRDLGSKAKYWNRFV